MINAESVLGVTHTALTYLSSGTKLIDLVLQTRDHKLARQAKRAEEVLGLGNQGLRDTLDARSWRAASKPHSLRYIGHYEDL
jgi:hypothetical protein